MGSSAVDAVDGMVDKYNPLRGVAVKHIYTISYSESKAAAPAGTVLLTDGTLPDIGPARVRCHATDLKQGIEGPTSVRFGTTWAHRTMPLARDP
jgi:hypothetical protein